MFRLSAEEWVNLKCQNGISSWGGDRQLPYAFNENGIAMLSTKLDPGDISRIKKAAFAVEKAYSSGADK